MPPRRAAARRAAPATPRTPRSRRSTSVSRPSAMFRLAGRRRATDGTARASAQTDRERSVQPSDRAALAIRAARVSAAASRSQVAQHRAVRLARAAGARTQLRRRATSPTARRRAPRSRASTATRRASAPCAHASRVTAGGDRRVAVAIAADPRAEHDRRGVERQRRPVASRSAAIERAQAARQRVPHASLEDARGRCALRRSASAAAAGRLRCPTCADDLAAQVGQDLVRAPAPVKSARSCRASASAMRRCFCGQGPPRDRRRVRGQHELDAQRDDRLGEPSASTPPSSSRRNVSSNEPGCGGAAGRAGSRAGGGRGGAARRCWRASGSARRRAPPARPISSGSARSRCSSGAERRGRPPRAPPSPPGAPVRLSRTAPSPSRARSVSPSIPPSIDTSSRSGLCGSSPRRHGRRC